MENILSSLDISTPSIVQKPAPPLAASVSAIITLHKEATRLGEMIQVLLLVPYIREVIIVEANSHLRISVELDPAAYQNPQVRVLRPGVPPGKGQAILAGWRAARSPILLLLDPDLVNLAPYHIVDLITPVISGQVDMSVGLFRKGSWATDYAHNTVPWLSGQRCLKSNLLNAIPVEAAAGYGFETALTASSRKINYQIQEVYLPGVSHSLFHPGSSFFSFFMEKLRTVAHISRAISLTNGWTLFFPSMRIGARLLFIAVLVLFLSSLAFNRSRAVAQVRLEDLEPLQLNLYERVLVVSPHPDDEMLGAGGLIRSALNQGSQVKVIMMTNGDGQFFAPFALDRRIRSNGDHYVAHGLRRQSETLQALEAIGLEEEDVYFLGYPDRGLLQLWLNNWQKDCPMKAAYTRVSVNPYMNSFTPSAAYCGSDLLYDIEQILADYLPDLVILPHPNDDHSDHRAATSFTRMALAKIEIGQEEYTPVVLGYLTHYGYFPQPRGYHVATPLLPPKPLLDDHNVWLKLDLAPDEVQAKRSAIQRYTTQMRLLGKFLPSFIRPNEIFLTLSQTEILPVDFSALPLMETGIKEMPNLPEPASATTSQMLLAGADIVGWKITRFNNQLILTADMRGKILPGLKYRILVKTPQGETLVFNHRPAAQILNFSSITAHIELNSIGDPDVLGFAADVQQGATLDRTGWYFIELKNWLP